MTPMKHESNTPGPTSGDGPGSSSWSGQHASEHESSGAPQEQSSWLADKAKAEATEAMQPMKESARKIVQDQKNVLADRIGGVAQAMDLAAGECGRKSPAMSEMFSAAAGSIRNASASLRQRQIDDLTGAMQQFARNRPAALFAGAIVAGFALSRFLKSSTSEQSGGAAR